MAARPADQQLGERRRAVIVLGVVCLVTLGVACVTLPAGRGLAYNGGLPLIGLLSLGLLTSLQVDGPLRRVLSTRPLVAIGLVSYGLYVYHWPVFVLVDRQRWDLPFVVVLAIKLAITVALTVASYFLVEQPIRRARRVPVRRTLGLGLAATAIVASLVVFVPQPTKFYAVDTAAAAQAAIDTAPVAPLVPLATSTTTLPVTTTVAMVTATSVLASTAPTTVPATPRPRDDDAARAAATGAHPRRRRLDGGGHRQRPDRLGGGEPPARPGVARRAGGLRLRAGRLHPGHRDRRP